MNLFKTNNFLIREFKEQDSIDCEEFLSDQNVMRFIGDGNFDFSKTSSIEMVRWFLSSADLEEGLGTWAIQEIKTGKVIGNCHLTKNVELDEVEFGLALSRKYWGNGFGTEICQKLLEYGYENLNLEKIVGTVHVENEASKSLLTKLGFTFDKEIELYGVKHELYLKNEFHTQST